MAMSLRSEVIEISIRLPYWSLTDWLNDLKDLKGGPPLFMWVAFDISGLVGILLAIRGDRRPFLFWNLCNLAMTSAVNFLPFPMSWSAVLDIFTVRPRILIFEASFISTIAICIAHREMRNAEDAA
jgi:hypothetical protein